MTTSLAIQLLMVALGLLWMVLGFTAPDATKRGQCFTTSAVWCVGSLVIAGQS